MNTETNKPGKNTLNIEGRFRTVQSCTEQALSDKNRMEIVRDPINPQSLYGILELEGTFGPRWADRK